VKLVVLTSLFLAATACAQWLNFPSAGIPRTADGKPDLTAPAPKNAEGKPILGGIWHRVPPPGTPSGANFGNTVTYYMPAGSAVPLQPWAADLLQQRRFGILGAGRPSERCLPHGVLGSMLPNIPFKIVETPGLTLILTEQLTQFRQIFTDGRSLPPDMQPAWFGYSIGHWEGETFVIETAGFNDLTWLDDSGHPNTEAMRTQERFRRIDVGHMTLEVLVDDPGAYTKPWKVTIPLELMPDTELIEDVCDNEKDAPHNMLK
jgi:hypothetical protein